jgi:putative Holliday junction resolvase
MGRIMGFDIGQKRLGIAVSDDSGTIASPVTVLDVATLKADNRSLKKLIDDYEPIRGIVGLPLSLSGDEGTQAQEVRTLAQGLLETLNLELVFFDERFSSADAKRAMREANVSEKQARGRIDMIAATLFLQAYLDSLKVKATHE